MKDIWPNLVKGNVNTVLGSVSWEQIEPDEGEYEFGELDEVLRGAREWGLKVVLLWFGAYKNGRRLPDSPLMFSPSLALLSSPLPTLLSPPLPLLLPLLSSLLFSFSLLSSSLLALPSAQSIGVCASMTPANPPRSHVNIRASVGQARLETLPSGAKDQPVRSNTSMRCPHRLL
jgi:hypothetical protein